MKKFFYSAIIILFFASSKLNAQQSLFSIQSNGSELVINDSISLKKGAEIQILLPAGKDFVFVNQKNSLFNSKLIGSVADIAGTGAGIIGMNTGNINTIRNSTKVVSTANTVRSGAEMIGRIQELPLSNKAKKIAGKKMQILDWTFTDDGYVITAILDKKKYDINIQEAVLAGEVGF